MKKMAIIKVLLVFTVAQILATNYLNLSQYIVLTVLPGLILCMPVSFKPMKTMLISFLIGVAVDFFSNGILGMTSFALVPVALGRQAVISLIFGAEAASTRDTVPLKRYGIVSFILAIFICTAAYFLFFIPLDSAGTRAIGFNLARYLLSVLSSTLVSILLVGAVTTD